MHRSSPFLCLWQRLRDEKPPAVGQGVWGCLEVRGSVTPGLYRNIPRRQQLELDKNFTPLVNFDFVNCKIYQLVQ